MNNIEINTINPCGKYTYEECRQTIYDAYTTADSSAVEEAINNFSKQITIDGNPTETEHRGLILSKCEIISKGFNCTEDATDKITTFFWFKIGVGKYETENDFIEGGPDITTIRNCLDKTLSKLCKGSFLSQKEKDLKHAIVGQKDEQEESSNDIQEVDEQIVKPEEESNDDIQEVDEQEESSNDIQEVDEQIVKPEEESNDDIQEVDEQIVDIQEVDEQIDIVETEENTDKPIEEDEIVDEVAPSKQWPLPIRFLLSIGRGIGNFFSTIFGWIGKLFSRG